MGMPDDYRRYLRLLGFERPPSGLEGLRQLVRRHLCRVPFENVSKLLLIGREGAGRMPVLGEFLDGLEFHDLGGTCYTSNPFFAELLRALGYQAELLGADMQTPDVHTVIRVRLDGREYHVDAGYAGPFREPVSLDELPREIPHGCYRYVVERGAKERDLRVSVFEGTVRRHGYLVHGPPRSLEYFRPVILDSWLPGKTFMTCLRITRFFDNQAVELRNATLTRIQGTRSEQRNLTSLDQVEAAVDRELQLPRCPVVEAIGVLERMTQKPFFAQGSGAQF